MDLTFDHIIMHYPINDIVCLVFGGTNDKRMIQEVTHVDKGIYLVDTSNDRIAVLAAH